MRSSPELIALTCFVYPVFRKDLVLSSSKPWRLASRLSRTHAAAMPEVVRHGLLVEPENHDALADAIEKLYEDSQLRALLADQGRQDVESYDMRRVARRFMEIVSTGTREGEVIAQ